MPARRIDGGKATLELLPNGVLHLEWDRDCTIATTDAESAMAAVDVLAAGQVHPMLVDMETTRTVTRGARSVFAIPCSASRIALLGSSPVDRMIANFFLGVNSPPCPTRFFTSRPLAVAWLQSAADEHPATA
ncbi:STAS/SEC14 domain-containing protein [Arthrobacter agilis]|uniref:DUF7793 family protein n=1 Tax=Arthrobacter agilis TaxID=37921 RepID=UPI000B35FF73|nr:STAS/SEC14 domain-containing protein [Arthrobacter agilis]OUM42279.1 STAS/SEC14 domain-containing protein [Arthrobacter agilis]PPB45621.1 STAS/SEC14 domain-containing protein [Arthrobacter agilis]TPV26398.1 STAS/SEC14 domain-containing protein [Arthrobacter agilis]VDR33709.1 Uncharacterised protein [Arthrobacter agilis]